MDLDLLPAFAAFVQHDCNHTMTAAALGCSQPAVHGKIARLAQQIGTPLYIRSGRNLTLTPRGEEVAALAAAVTRLTGQFEQNLPTKPVLAAGPGAWTGLLPDLLRPPFPTPLIRSAQACWDAVRRGEALLGLAAGDAPTGLAHQLFTIVGMRLVAPAGAALDPSQPCPWILPSPGRPHRTAAEAWLATEGIIPSEIIAVDDWQVTLSLVRMGMGRTLINDCYCPDDLPHMPVDWAPVVYRFGWRKDRNSQAVALLRQWDA